MSKKLFVKLYCDFADAIIRRDRRGQQKRIYRRRRTQVRGVTHSASGLVVSFFMSVYDHLYNEQ